MAETWPQWLESPKHIAEAADWVRWKTQGRVRLVVAVGANSIAVAKDREMDAEDAIVVLMDIQDQIAQALRQLDEKKQTHDYRRLPDR
jgi:hypothetical protein